ncbi:MAG: hypothetical protein FWD23_05940 [Oscillospiraceae bacterium]|nr:hypothetical protein [Oscillospiraceae bacterium]
MRKLILLPLFLILTAFAGFAAGCGETAPGNAEKAGSPTDAPNDDASKTPEAQKKYAADYLPDKTYGGYEFRMVILARGQFDFITEADIEEETGDTVYDAIYKRNRLIEEKYDVKFKQSTVSEYPALTSTFKKSTAAGSDDFDLCMIISRDAWAQALTGTVVPVHKLPCLDISQPWYSQDVNSEITINGKLYFAYSDECLNMFEQTLSVLFNKKLIEDFALDNVYKLVTDNKWTIDKFFEMSKGIAADLDGDNTMTDRDRYGILSQNDLLYPCFWVSSGIKTVSKDANDLLVFTGDSEKLYNVLDKVYQNLYGGGKIFFDTFSDKITSYQNQGGDDARRVSGMQFQDNLGLFYVACVGMIPTLRSMETDFGILPFPKHDESQEKYYSRVIDGWISCVPNTAPDLERTSIIMEALAVESRNNTIPAYFETALRTKHTRDDESQDMLDLIHANRTMDLGDTFYMDPVRNIYSGVLNAKKDNFVSAVEKAASTVDKTLARANEAALALD